MEEKDILEKLKNENRTYVPDSRNEIVNRAKADGILQLEGAQNDTVRNGNTLALRKRKIKYAAIAACALVAATSLVIGLSIGLRKKPDGGFNPPLIEKPGDGYSVGAVATAKLMYEYLGEEPTESQPLSTNILSSVSRSAESGMENFGIYFSAFDSFFADDMLNTVYTPLENNEYDNEAVIYGKYANGAAAEFKMAYNEIYAMETSTESEVNLYLDGYISLGYNSGYPLSGKRTVSIVNGEELQTALEIRAYRNYTDKTSYAQMELTDAGFKFTVVLNGNTESEAVMYRPADSSNVAYAVEILGDNGGTFTVGMPSEGRDEVTIDYVKGDKNSQFYAKTSHKDSGFILCDYLIYQPYNNGTAWSVTGSIEEKVPENGELIIPAYVQGKPVTKIADSAFANKNYVKSVIMPDTIESIGSSAFYYCSNLKSVVLSTAITSIPYTCFYQCSELESINLHDDIEMIYPYAFFYCRKLADFNMPANLAYAGTEAFYRCKGNSELKLGAKFYSMGEGAFSAWNDLQTITVDSANTEFKSIDNCLIDIRYKRLYAGCANSVIPTDGSVETIAVEAFTNCKINSINIPTSVKAIEAYAFSGCEELTQITIPDKKIEIGRSVFHSTGYYNNTANWEGNLLYIGKHLICGKMSTADLNEVITVKQGTLTVAQEAFNMCNFESIVFNSELLYIGAGVISGSRFAYLSFDGENEFYTITDNCLIDNEAHRLIAAGTAAVIPDDGSVTSIGYGALVGNINGYGNDEPFVIPASVTEIESYAFQNSNFNKLVLQSHLIIKDHAFSNCFVGEIVFKTGVILWDHAFENCGLEIITFEGNDIFIPHDNMLFNCYMLRTINFNGTMNMWLELTDGGRWYDAVADITINCTDGKLDKWGHEITD